MSGRLRQAALLFAVLSIFTLSGQSSDPAILKEAGWKPLLDGRSTAGWQAENPAKGSWVATKTVAWNPDVNPRELVASGGRGALIANGPKGGVTNLVTGRTFGDIELYAEFLLAQKSNSGVYLHGLYEVQVFDSFGVEKPKSSDCGGIYERWIDNRGVGGAAPRVNASRPPGDWQSFHIWFQAPRFDGVGK